MHFYQLALAVDRERVFFSIYVHPVSVCFFTSAKMDAIFLVSSSERVFISEFARCLITGFSETMRKACEIVNKASKSHDNAAK